MVYMHHEDKLMTTREYIPEAPCLCINLRRVAQKVTDFYDKALKPAGVSVNQYSLLVNISRMEGCGTGELAQQVRLEKSTLVRTLRPLLRAGLIDDRSSGESRRRKLYISPHGEEVLKKAFPLWENAQKDVAAALGENYNSLADIFEQISLLL